MKILSHKIEELPSLKYNTLINCQCENEKCNKVFQKQRKTLLADINRGRKNFCCSKKCSGEFHTQRATKDRIGKQNLNNKYKCFNCSIEFERNFSDIVNPNRVFCSSSCASKYQWIERRKFHPKKIKITKNRILLEKFPFNCKQCNKEILRNKSQTDKKKNKNGLVFCSRSCRMTYQNLNNPKKYGCRKSKAEIYLFNLIKSDFPLLNILENDRTTLKSKLEIDLYIPELKLAIELNGPVHYIPIFGEDRLKKCQNRDLLKQQEINQIGLSLIIIDISRLNSKKKTEAFLIEYYNSHIKPILNGCECWQSQRTAIANL